MCVNSNEEFSFLFLRIQPTQVARSHKKASACLLVKAPRQDIFFSSLSSSSNDEFGLITTHKKVKQRVLYTEWIIQTDARFRVVVIV